MVVHIAMTEKRMPVEAVSSKLCAKHYLMKIGRWWKFLLHNVDILTAKNVALGAPKGLGASRTRLRANSRE